MSTAPRTILHADLDAFFAAVEQRDRPELRGKPVVVGGAAGRGVVAAASYEARVYGIHSAMPSFEARRRCPHAIFVAGDMAKYRCESRRVFAIFDRYSPLVEGLSMDEAFLDLTGTARLLGDAVSAAERLRAEVRAATGLTLSVGIAPVKMVAKIASDLAKPDGLRVVAPDEVRAFLAPLPVGRIWGVGAVARARLDALGIATIGDLAAAPDEMLRRALGGFGVGLAGLARGEDARAVEPDREAKSYGEENTFERDVAERAALADPIHAHADAIARRLRRDRLAGHGVTVKLKLARPLGRGRYPLVTRSLLLRRATDDGEAIARAALSLLARVEPWEPIRLVGVAVTRLEPNDASQLALALRGPTDQRRARLNAAVDAIHVRFGDQKLRRGAGDVRRTGLSTGIKRGERE
ncbi:MAG: DNA polymerase IV [Deltaproteobacteria bacterium]|nr:DNA polymerase IV [Deltaproteobacteria bacterium]